MSSNDEVDLEALQELYNHEIHKAMSIPAPSVYGLNQPLTAKQVMESNHSETQKALIELAARKYQEKSSKVYGLSAGYTKKQEYNTKRIEDADGNYIGCAKEMTRGIWTIVLDTVCSEQGATSLRNMIAGF